MTSELGWTEDPTVLLAQQVLISMTGDNLDPADALAEELGASPSDVGDAFDMLAQQRLVRTFPQSLGDTFTGEAMRTTAGKGKVGEWESLRSTGRVQRACNAALLSWLDALDGETVSSTDEFVGDVRSFYFGVPFSSAAIRNSAKELKELKLIKGTGTWGGPIMRPEITHLGRVVVSRHGGDLVEWQASHSTGGTTVTVHGSTGVAVAANSPGASQSVTVTTNVADQVANLAAALQAMLPVLKLEPAQEASAHGLVIQLQQAASEVETDPGKVKRLVSAVRAIAVNAAGGAAGSALVALTEQVAGNL